MTSYYYCIITYISFINIDLTNIYWLLYLHYCFNRRSAYNHGLAQVGLAAGLSHLLREGP
jgi:hypothetical protein